METYCFCSVYCYYYYFVFLLHMTLSAAVLINHRSNDIGFGMMIYIVMYLVVHKGLKFCTRAHLSILWGTSIVYYIILLGIFFSWGKICFWSEQESNPQSTLHTLRRAPKRWSSFAFNNSLSHIYVELNSWLIDIYKMQFISTRSSFEIEIRVNVFITICCLGRIRA